MANCYIHPVYGPLNAARCWQYSLRWAGTMIQKHLKKDQAAAFLLQHEESSEPELRPVRASLPGWAHSYYSVAFGANV